MKPFRVVCVDNTVNSYNNNPPNLFQTLKVGEIYTVLEIIHDDFTGKMIAYYRLMEIEDCAYSYKYFRPVDETFGEVVCDTIEKQVEFEEAISV